MRKLLFLLVTITSLYSCKKESAVNSNEQYPYFLAIDKYLQENLQSIDYTQIDLKNLIVDTSDSGKTLFIRVPFRNKSLKTDFIFLETNSIGFCHKSSIVNILAESSSLSAITGTIKISTIKRDKIKDVKLVQGIAINNPEEESLPYDGLPPVTVTAYIYRNNAYTFSNLINTDNLLYSYNGYSYNGGLGSNGGGTTYAGHYIDVNYSYGGGGNSGVSEVELDNSESANGEDMSKIFNCFSSIPDVGATFSLKLCSDIPDNSNYYSGFDDHLSPGHTFLVLTKTSGTQSVTKAFGFYPSIGYKSLTFSPVTEKIVNDANHEINASLEMKNLTQSDFNLIKSKAIADALKKYDLDNFNCSDYALGIFNTVRPTNPIILTPFIGFFIVGNPPITFTATVKNTPQMLFKKLADIAEDGASEAANVKISLNHDYRSPVTTGGCN